MFFTSTGTGDDEDLENASVVELAPSAWESIKADCAKFQADNSADLELAEQRVARNTCYDLEAAGRDFWYTCNGHGVGFWDREALASDGLGRRLSDVCRVWGESDIYRGDDGLIYVS